MLRPPVRRVRISRVSCGQRYGPWQHRSARSCNSRTLCSHLPARNGLLTPDPTHCLPLTRLSLSCAPWKYLPKDTPAESWKGKPTTCQGLLPSLYTLSSIALTYQELAPNWLTIRRRRVISTEPYICPYWKKYDVNIINERSTSCSVISQDFWHHFAICCY